MSARVGPHGEMDGFARSRVRARDLSRIRARRHVVRQSPSVFAVRSTDGTYNHQIVLMPDGALRCSVDQHGNRCWAAVKVAQYLLRNPQRIEEAI